MANAKIQWLQKVAGRQEGDLETVEIDTPFMRGCLKQRRFKVLEYVAAPKPAVKSESDLMGLTKPKPAPKPKAPKKDDDGGDVETQGRTWV